MKLKSIIVMVAKTYIVVFSLPFLVIGFILAYALGGVDDEP